MKVYKHPGYDSDVRSDARDKYFSHGNNRVEGASGKCGCGRNCGSQCSYESSNRPPVEFSYSNNDAFALQDGGQYGFMDQESAELIWVKESCNITVNSTDTQAAISLQAGIQLAIALVLNISIADAGQRDAVSQELMQQFNTTQTNKQKVFIYNTKDAVVTTQDTDVAINIQALLQVLLALVLLVDIL
ncbi:spore coat protein [Ralstonia pickettii]|nr:spore coat protein [Ralstonia pickettii]